MRTLLLRFTINLREYDISSAFTHDGPLFHRWLPDGENDAIVLDIPKSKAQLKLWFDKYFEEIERSYLSYKGG